MIPLLTGVLLSWHSLGDYDIWFHLRAGRDLLEGQGVIATNLHSFTEPDHPWVNHEWMFQALTALTGPRSPDSASSAAQPDVLGWHLTRSLLTLLLLLTLIGGDGGWAKFRGRAGPVVAAWSGVPILAALMLIWPRLTIRPELFSYLFFVVLVRGTERVFRGSQTPSGSGWPPVVRIFLLTVVWAQFHGFAALVPAVLLLAWILTPIQSRVEHHRTFPDTQGPPRWRGAALIGLSLVALTLTPNGWNGLLMPLRALGQFSQDQVDLRATISELVPLQDSPNSLALTITAYRVCLVWGLIWIIGTWGRVSLLRIIIFALAGWAAWNTQRSSGFFGLAFILLHSGAGTRPWRFSLPGRVTTRRPTATAVVGLALTFLVAGIFWPRIVNDDFYLQEGVGRRFGAGLAPAHYQIGAATALASHRNPRVFANLDAAGFLLANTSARPFIDGRTEAYSADLWNEYHRIRKADDQSLQLLAQRSVEWVCLATGGGAFIPLAEKLLVSPAWKLAVAEGAGLLFRRTDEAGDPPVTSARDQSGLLVRAARDIRSPDEKESPTRKADLCLAAGRLYKFAADPGPREEVYRLGLEFKGNHPNLNHNLGNLLLNRNGFKEALPLFTTALEVNPRLVGSALNAGVCQMRLGRPADAVDSFRRAVSLDPDRFEGWVNLAAAYQGSGNRQGAVSALKRALEIRPRDSRLQKRLRELGG
ncbi:MAG: tetratricopeptide repeat protein [Candidatus Krumholzibacteriota bacterium]